MSVEAETLVTKASALPLLSPSAPVAKTVYVKTLYLLLKLENVELRKAIMVFLKETIAQANMKESEVASSLGIVPLPTTSSSPLPLSTTSSAAAPLPYSTTTKAATSTMQQFIKVTRKMRPKVSLVLDKDVFHIT